MSLVDPDRGQEFKNISAGWIGRISRITDEYVFYYRYDDDEFYRCDREEKWVPSVENGTYVEIS